MNKDNYLKNLERIVNISSGSNEYEGIKKVQEFLISLFGEKWSVKKYSQNEGKNPVIVLRNNLERNIEILLLGHCDTVFSKNITNSWKYKLENNIVTGPGVADMKSGLLSLIEVAEEFKEKDISMAVILNSDEEISSINSRAIIEKYAQGAKYAFVFEPARKNGNLVKERKGLIKYQIEFFGKASHAGNNPEEGINAILAATYWIQEISKLHNWKIKNSVNVGIMEGGRGINIIPDYASFKFEGRSFDLEFFERIKKILKELEEKEIIKGIKVRVREIGYRPPMIVNNRTEILIDIFEKKKEELGISFNWETVGGCSDGNFLSILGLGVADGIGPIGGNVHSYAEYLDISSIEERIKLVKKVINTLIENREIYLK